MTDKEPKKIMVIHGPNLNMLGKREPEIYGSTTLDEINNSLVAKGKGKGVVVETYQSNHEGDIVDKIQSCFNIHKGLIINPGAYTHTSVAIRDAILGIGIQHVVEIHLSNIYKREPFRHKSYISDIATGQIAGFGVNGYYLALDAMMALI